MTDAERIEMLQKEVTFLLYVLHLIVGSRGWRAKPLREMAEKALRRPMCPALSYAPNQVAAWEKSLREDLL